MEQCDHIPERLVSFRGIAGNARIVRQGERKCLLLVSMGFSFIGSITMYPICVVCTIRWPCWLFIQVSVELE